MQADGRDLQLPIADEIQLLMYRRKWQEIPQKFPRSLPSQSPRIARTDVLRLFPHKLYVSPPLTLADQHSRTAMGDKILVYMGHGHTSIYSCLRPLECTSTSHASCHINSLAFVLQTDRYLGLSTKPPFLLNDDTHSNILHVQNTNTITHHHDGTRRHPTRGGEEA